MKDEKSLPVYAFLQSIGSYCYHRPLNLKHNNKEAFSHDFRDESYFKSIQGVKLMEKEFHINP